MDFENHVFVFLEQIELDVPDHNGETMDDVKPEVKEWLNATCVGRWRFRQFLGDDVTDVQGGELIEGQNIVSRVEFTSSTDAVQFMKWMLAQAKGHNK